MKALIAFVALCLASPALAQAPASQASAAPVDDARTRAAEALAIAMDLKGQLTAANAVAVNQLQAGLITKMIEATSWAAAAKQSDPARYQTVVAGLRKTVADEFRKLNAETEPLIYEGTLEIYARNFSAEELRQIQAFYETPFGRKLLERQPQLTKDCIELSQRLLAERIPSLIQSLQQRIEADRLTFTEPKP